MESTPAPFSVAFSITEWSSALSLATLASGVAMGLLLAAAWHDLRTRLIPDTLCLCLAIFGIFYRLQVGVIDFAFSAITALLLFFLLFAAFNRGVVGGGDVKLMVATGLWLSPPDCYVFLVATAIAGGVLAVFQLSLGAILRGRGRRDAADIMPVAAPAQVLATSADAHRARGFLSIELERVRSGSPLAYGVAIAVGGCYALLVSLGG